MQYIFTPNEKGTHVRVTDAVKGTLITIPDGVQVHSAHPILSSSSGINLRTTSAVNVRQQAFDAAAAAFESLSLGKQALWEPVRAAVAKAILAGDLATAKTIIETVPTGLYPDMETDRDIFLALFV